MKKIYVVMRDYGYEGSVPVMSFISEIEADKYIARQEDSDYYVQELELNEEKPNEVTNYVYAFTSKGYLFNGAPKYAVGDRNICVLLTLDDVDAKCRDVVEFQKTNTKEYESKGSVIATSRTEAIAKVKALLSHASQYYDYKERMIDGQSHVLYARNKNELLKKYNLTADQFGRNRGVLF